MTIADQVADYRRDGFCVRTIARWMGLTVGQVHVACRCRDRESCQGPGCRVGGAS